MAPGSPRRGEGSGFTSSSAPRPILSSTFHPSGDSLGDTLTFANEVFDARSGKKVGTDQGQCVRTVVGEAFECYWTTFLPRGQITVEGPFYDAADSTLAITGGTGAYRNARGTMDLHARSETEFDFVFHVTG